MNPLRKAYTPLWLFVEGLGLMVLGVVLLYRPAPMLEVIAAALRWGLLALGVLEAVGALLRRDRRDSLVTGAGLMLLSGALFAFPKVFGGSVSLAFGLWSMLNALSKAVFAVQLHRDGQKGVWWAAITGAIHGVFAVLLLADPLSGVLSLAILLGIYCVVFGLTVLGDAVRETLGTDVHGKRIRQRIRIAPPILLTSLLPLWLLRSLDDPDEAAETARWTRRETNDERATRDMEIFLHLSKDTAFGMGHVDIALGDRVLSYGCYDLSSNRLFGLISDGVLVEADRERYIPFCVGHEKKKLIGFGVTLTEEQKARVARTADKLMEGSVLWTPPAGSTQDDFAHDAGAVFHKLTRGRFRTYNALKTNCVALADILCGATGLDLMNLQGIVTPGTYYAFLDRQFLRRNSIVISRTVYRGDPG